MENSNKRPHLRGTRNRGGGRERREARRRGEMRYRAPLPAVAAEYGHIQLLARPISPRPEGEGADAETFIKRKSLQVELEERAQQELEDPTILSEDNDEYSTENEVPKSFAEATMGRSRPRRSTCRANENTTPDLLKSYPMSLGSLSTFKVLGKDGKKTKKKWTTLDIGVGEGSIAVDSGSEFGGNTNSEDFSEELSDITSPCLVPVHQQNPEVILQSDKEEFPGLPTVVSQPISNSWNSFESSSSHSDKDKGRAIYQESEADDPTPTQLTTAIFDSLPSASTNPTPTTEIPTTFDSFPPPVAAVIPISISFKSAKPAFDPTREPFDPTPKKAVFNSSPNENYTPTHLRHRTVSSFNSNSQAEHSPLAREGDCEFKQAELARIMGRLDDAFDVVEWDPDLPSGGMSNSPEIMAAALQPVAPTPTYTTVGSIVKNNATPTFAPPIRIQRDGVGRRPPMVGSQRGENYFSTRTPPQMALPHHMSFGLPHATRGTLHYGNQAQAQVANQQPQSRLSPCQMSELEKEAKLKSLGVSSPNIRPENLAGRPLLQKTDPFVADPASDQYIQQLGRGDAASSSSHVSSLLGLQKFQTIQRLSQYPNPMQQVAKERLSSISASKMQLNTSSTVSISSQSFEQSDKNNTVSGKDIIMQLDAEIGDPQLMTGDLDLGFKFPLNMSRDNTFTLASGNHTAPYRNASGSGNNATNSAPPGYPRPLTAGPPGQRPGMNQFKSLLNSGPQPVAKQPYNGQTQDNQFNIQQQVAGHHQNLQHEQSGRSFYLQDVANISNWTTNVQSEIKPASKTFSLNQTSSSTSAIHDTQPLEQLLQYYPHGFPENMKGQYKQLDILNANPMLDSRARGQIQQERTNERFAAGLRALDRTIDDHVQDMEDQECLKGGRIPIQRLPKPIGAERKVLTVEKTLAMSPSEVAAPLLDNLFGSLLAYADKNTTTVTKRSLSRFVDAPAWMVDDTPVGRKSCFGEDWGAPPKRKGRDAGWKYESKTDNSWSSESTW